MTQPLPPSGWQPSLDQMPLRPALAVSGSATPPRGRAALSATGTARRGVDAGGNSSRPPLSHAVRRPHGNPRAHRRYMKLGGTAVGSAADGAQ